MFTKKIILRKIKQILLHIFFWYAVLLFFTNYFSFNSDDFNYTLSFSLFLMPITIATTYVSIYKLIPEYLIQKRYIIFVLYSLYTLIISAYLIQVSVYFGLIYLSNFKYDEMPPISKSMFFIMIAVYLVTIIVSAFKLLKLNLKNTEKAKNLESKVLETQLRLREQELNYLKMQIHPHFLFNTLNTMYGFALKKADETPDMILKLSSLLDYLLYQIDKPFVLLTDEINHIKDYISLEKMRFDNTLDITFNTVDISKVKQISPMLFLPFIENSFKHGTLKNGILKIRIDLTCTPKEILFYIENTNSNTTKNNSGIGLENIQKRLDLLYKNQYILDIQNTENTFNVSLKLNNN